MLDKGSNADVLKAYGVKHAGGGLAEAWGWCALDGFAGKALGDQATQGVQVDEVGEFEPITKRAAGRDDWIAKPERADGNAQVNISRSTAGVGST